MKNSMNGKDDCLAVAVTFNHLTEINPSIDIFRGEDPDAFLCPVNNYENYQQRVQNKSKCFETVKRL